VAALKMKEKAMPFVIVQQHDVDKTRIEHELPPSIATVGQARAAREKMAEAYEVHGYDPEQDQSWARDKNGVQSTFWVAGR
jgi:thiamine pyrophosphate-dependent acetolactate synthase large subunit-like protein